MWRAQKQGREMAYGQPYFYVEITSEEVKIARAEKFDYHHGQLLIKLSRYFDSRTDAAGNATHKEKFDRKFVDTRLAVAFKYFSKIKRIPILKEGKVRYFLTSVNPTSIGTPLEVLPKNPIVSKKWVAVIHPNCFSDVSAAANYFGDRLPNEFYEQYAEGKCPIISRI